MLVHGKVITIHRAGRTLRRTACEKCGEPFAYVLSRMGVGKGSAVYGIGQTGAAHRAAAAAEQNLTSRLRADDEPVPCPACHWVNEAAVQSARIRQHRWILPTAAVVAGVATLPMMVCLTLWSSLRVTRAATGWGVAAASLAVAVVSLPILGLLATRYLRRRLLDPNATYPRWPSVPPGTPPPLTEHHDAATGRTVLVPAPRRVEVPSADGGVVLRPAQVVFPGVCCLCLSDETTGYRPPMATQDGSDLPIPVCGPCQYSLRGRWWRRFGLVFLLCLGLPAGVLAIVPGDPIGKWSVFAAFAPFIGLIAGVVSAGRAARPYRTSVIDAGRGVWRFTADSPAYTALVADLARAADATPIPVN